MNIEKIVEDFNAELKVITGLEEELEKLQTVMHIDFASVSDEDGTKTYLQGKECSFINEAWRDRIDYLIEKIKKSKENFAKKWEAQV
ncbi:hypothetical protein [Enterococcus sp. AZ126]|uniref:hypothetical protein n=1 Tax=Enterococcus sp. AZ126 TaxID=2774635 RepID=UPI003F1FD515